ncbi:hypothetical protein CANTEDRAFT_114090 [Yamadazyma tenuis ATCC 10573]|uniref:Uncharacterized protein n=1 Tax=Candida tenuis (strain ATCC 10573 / BCRC 21748 / CBS 615 / JCM 9827 / NBRC 10315 / NRRL Y-1498 / VKM Y-70) TaxID=590646 RepID=G3B312_CANTC|nr:uncharacterized protein CANTEDRAFT_114090 [Yamadazyma tenuis ATCC 10573]XP_006686662.1 uncharacterized protein CANTEDRAFT_114090 [Yamadazyma tenuis ATCC 10573]EGV64347.1 hypothetical protein CANTEDRAFT_114090 [Yamadazyma tenuis ATCC 10573]EGV64348.1 hypothetical protein CANTEDRAFT_114090 [Yamadazyma tenuis ATCC 10573]
MCDVAQFSFSFSYDLAVLFELNIGAIRCLNTSDFHSINNNFTPVVDDHTPQTDY